MRVLIARRDDDGAICILGHGTAPSRGCVSQGVIQDLNAAQLAIRTALRQAEKEARIKILRLFCGVNGRNVETFIREGNVKLEQECVNLAHMDDALDIASRDILAPGKSVITSVTAQEWYVDDMRVIDPAGIRGNVLKARVHFARIPTVIEDNLLSCIESQNREVEDIIFLPIAASLGCLTPEDMELGVGVLDIGRSTTGLAVYRDRRIMGTHCFAWGGYHITRDVAAGLQVSFEEAEELILEHGLGEDLIQAGLEYEDDASELGMADNARPIKLKTAVRGAPSEVDRRELDVIIYERSRELMTKVRQQLQSRGLTKNLVRGVVLTGGASVIKNQAALAEAIFQVPARIGTPEGFENLSSEINHPAFSSVLGVVRHGFEQRSSALLARNTQRGALGMAVHGMRSFLGKYFL